MQNNLNRIWNQRKLSLVCYWQKTTTVSDENSATTVQGWNVRFFPHIDMLKTGNDPVRILRELNSLGEIESTMDASSLPDFESLDPEECLLGWDIR